VRAHPEWTTDLLTTEGRHGAAKCLHWLQTGAPGYKPESKAGRKAQEVFVSAAAVIHLLYLLFVVCCVCCACQQ
jgi:hypothetical protein